MERCRGGWVVCARQLRNGSSCAGCWTRKPSATTTTACHIAGRSLPPKMDFDTGLASVADAEAMQCMRLVNQSRMARQDICMQTVRLKLRPRPSAGHKCLSHVLHSVARRPIPESNAASTKAYPEAARSVLPIHPCPHQHIQPRCRDACIVVDCDVFHSLSLPALFATQLVSNLICGNER